MAVDWEANIHAVNQLTEAEAKVFAIGLMALTELTFDLLEEMGGISTKIQAVPMEVPPGIKDARELARQIENISLKVKQTAKRFKLDRN